ncbi:tetratricopeptide repeat protein [Bradyrhizobium sp. WSM471]|uniref:tetratricopeptide repeat protein n=1 Tax=Bradyrhizobium sp. WSM471 TaxID=319017 RepID=UPI00024D2A9D|nr:MULTISPECIES: tetratricopeptide repeat protein [Bradyrhizobium]EHR03022.1 tetratricopeptide repeat protein [Bradyrhizobium sp. WSM471]UFW38267.1 tetratricopeptide repeat protein [Bradyrhizobium canariense]
MVFALRPLGMTSERIVPRLTFFVGLMMSLVATPAFSQSASELNDRGNKSYSRGAYDQAATYYSAAITQKSDDASLFHNRGLAEFKLSQYMNARADFSRAISMRPTVAAFFNSRGGLFLATRDYTLAVKDFTEANRLEPGNPMFVENWRRAEAALSASKIASAPVVRQPQEQGAAPARSASPCVDLSKRLANLSQEDYLAIRAIERANAAAGNRMSGIAQFADMIARGQVICGAQP